MSRSDLWNVEVVAVVSPPIELLLAAASAVHPHGLTDLGGQSEDTLREGFKKVKLVHFPHFFLNFFSFHHEMYLSTSQLNVVSPLIKKL